MADEDTNDHTALDHDPEPDDGPAHEPADPDEGEETDPDDVNPLVDVTDDEGNEQGPKDVIDPEEGSAAGGTAHADAIFGADTVDEELGDDAPSRPERLEEEGSSTRAPGLSEDEDTDWLEAREDDDEDYESVEDRARARRDAFVDEVLGREEAIVSAYGGGPRQHPASSAVRSDELPEFFYSRNDDGDPVCEVCGSVLDEEEVNGTSPSGQTAARHDRRHRTHDEEG